MWVEPSGKDAVMLAIEKVEGKRQQVIMEHQTSPGTKRLSPSPAQQTTTFAGLDMPDKSHTGGTDQSIDNAAQTGAPPSWGMLCHEAFCFRSR